VKRQNGVADYKYVVSDDPLPPGYVTLHKRFANFAIKWPFTLLSSITQQQIKLET